MTTFKSQHVYFSQSYLRGENGDLGRTLPPEKKWSLWLAVSWFRNTWLRRHIQSIAVYHAPWIYTALHTDTCLFIVSNPYFLYNTKNTHFISYSNNKINLSSCLYHNPFMLMNFFSVSQQYEGNYLQKTDFHTPN